MKDYLRHECKFHHREIVFIEALEDAALEEIAPRVADLEQRIAELDVQQRGTVDNSSGGDER